MKTADLIGLALDWAVATALGYTRSTIQGVAFGGKRWKKLAPLGFWDEVDADTSRDGTFHPSTNWSQGGPIIEREGLWLAAPHQHRTEWYADSKDCTRCFGPTPLIAAMRCYATSKLGNEVNLPKDLQ